MGCPIRKSAHQGIFAPKRGLSQLITSFIACESQGIRHTPFTTFARLLGHAELTAWSVDYTFSISLLLLVTLLCPICQRSIWPSFYGLGRNSRSRTCFGGGPGYPCPSLYIENHRAELQTSLRGVMENNFSFVSSSCVLPRVSFCLFFENFSTCVLLSSPERRCSSRTFRYGYLVTT